MGQSSIVENIEGLFTVLVMLLPTRSFIVDIWGWVLSAGGVSAAFSGGKDCCPLTSNSFSQLIWASYKLTTLHSPSNSANLWASATPFYEPILPFINWLTDCKSCRKHCTVVWSVFFFFYFFRTTRKPLWNAFSHLIRNVISVDCSKPQMFHFHAHLKCVEYKGCWRLLDSSE